MKGESGLVPGLGRTDAQGVRAYHAGAYLWAYGQRAVHMEAAYKKWLGSHPFPVGLCLVNLTSMIDGLPWGCAGKRPSDGLIPPEHTYLSWVGFYRLS